MKHNMERFVPFPNSFIKEGSKCEARGRHLSRREILSNCMAEILFLSVQFKEGGKEETKDCRHGDQVNCVESKVLSPE